MSCHEEFISTMLAKFPYKTFVFYTSAVPNFVYVQCDVMAQKKNQKITKVPSL